MLKWLIFIWKNFFLLEKKIAFMTTQQCCITFHDDLISAQKFNFNLSRPLQVAQSKPHTMRLGLGQIKKCFPRSDNTWFNYVWTRGAKSALQTGATFLSELTSHFFLHEHRICFLLLLEWAEQNTAHYSPASFSDNGSKIVFFLFIRLCGLLIRVANAFRTKFLSRSIAYKCEEEMSRKKTDQKMCFPSRVEKIWSNIWNDNFVDDLSSLEMNIQILISVLQFSLYRHNFQSP